MKYAAIIVIYLRLGELVNLCCHEAGVSCLHVGVDLACSERMPQLRSRTAPVAGASSQSDSDGGYDNDLSGLSLDGKMLINVFETKFNELKTYFSGLLQEKADKIKFLEEKVDNLESRLEKVEQATDDGLAIERKNDLIVSGESVPLVKMNESCTEIVQEIMKDRLKLIVPTDHFITAHRIGRKPVAQRPDKRNILMKFKNADFKDEVLHACRNEKPSDLYVNENVTPTRATILYVLRRAKAKYPSIVSGCQSRNGKVLAWVKPVNPSAAGAHNVRVMLNTRKALDDFCSKTLKTSLDTFIPEWPHDS
ncbi:hypothetical protein SNEBB_000913 [Seison nebaliae]|nr:hypothetical protein SNEBB_000913 [Seison nebaliae]